MATNQPAAVSYEPPQNELVSPTRKSNSVSCLRFHEQITRLKSSPLICEQCSFAFKGKDPSRLLNHFDYSSSLSLIYHLINSESTSGMRRNSMRWFALVGNGRYFSYQNVIINFILSRSVSNKLTIVPLLFHLYNTLELLRRTLQCRWHRQNWRNQRPRCGHLSIAIQTSCRPPAEHLEHGGPKPENQLAR